ncbi:MAG: mersacidin/lichenicidin family type 2 lantibiotic [Caldilineaceae bacterium]
MLIGMNHQYIAVGSTAVRRPNVHASYRLWGMGFMLRETIIRAWKDPEFRMELSAAERAALPENPAGSIELTDEELEIAVGSYGRSSGRPPSGGTTSTSSNICNIRWPSPPPPPNEGPPPPETPPTPWRPPHERPSVKPRMPRW